jgi:CBS domain containing-hemolysin-like protein
MTKKGFLARLLGGRNAPAETAKDEFSSERKQMIRGIHELSETTVKEVMVPRIDVFSLPADSDPAEALEKVADCGHSRIPIYRDTIDNVVGVLYAKDLLRVASRPSGFKLEAAMRKPFFVPESKRIDSLLREMKRRRVHIAIAVDEYGGTSGIVCLEDIIEVIVGEIQDEFDDEREDILPAGADMWICDGRVNLEDLNEALGISLPAGEFDTLGGYVFDLFGKIPVKYEKMSRDGIDFIIQDMDGHKINTVKIVLRERAEGQK